MQLVSLQMNNSIKFKDKTWDFRKAFTKCSNHGFHTYPAMMIPQVARKLIEMYGKDKEVLLDPFMGSGTTLSVAKRMKRNSIGIEIVSEYYEMVRNQLEPVELYLLEPKVKYEKTKLERRIAIR